MTSRAAAMAYATGIAAIVTTTLAATIFDGRPREAGYPVDPRATSVGIRWVPGWLREPLSRALKDANDPRDRKR